MSNSTVFADDDPAPGDTRKSRPNPSTQRHSCRPAWSSTQTSIRGNQELPKVLYIVPWKESGTRVTWSANR